ncbi:MULTISPECIES: IclR family transcriptional regulator [Paenibacillus]|uniref:Helix-turn-helix domain-containing protein n=1 Tax=Paenibacillus phytohabitans TaxID=2654978 RepID=A0ABX1YBE2_9BACL|nr:MULTISPECIES: IclR family transcriptional regulator [unclassified Paenibacillus]AIQ27370.1 IclR family transcriptional regulator [Paenibacillus sp. FSL P4-0081]NOU77386.1 helix-turn-helix domain-containing protein [Paenibacillus phytohabitans]OMF24692.1 IclR family transcriptional regulator [Paenibacillus sp. FSL H8-0259]
MEDRKLTVRAVERALDILLCFTQDNDYDLSLTEISAKIGLHKSTVHRLLTTLEEKGFLQRDEGTEKYRLGIRIWELSTHLPTLNEPAVLLLPAMERLRDRLGETVSLYLRDNLERVRIQAVQSRQAIRRVAQIGARLPLSVGASSKVLAAYAPPEVQVRLLADPAWPEAVDRSQYLEQLKEITRCGYATSFEEREPGAAAVAVPITGRAGGVVAALSLSGPVSRLSRETLEDYAVILGEAAAEMGLMMG